MADPIEAAVATTPEGMTPESVSEIVTKAVAAALEQKALEDQRSFPNIVKEPLGEKKFRLSNILAAQVAGNTPETWRMYAKHEMAAIERSNKYEMQTKAVLGEGTVGTTSLMTGAGVLVPIEYSTDLISLVRAKTVVRQLGASTYRASSETGWIPRQSGAATGYWLGENTSITESEPTFDQIQYIIRKLAAFSVAGNEIIFDSNPDAEQVVLADLAEVLALAEDIAYLNGVGTGATPKGIINQGGISTNSLATNGRTPTFDDFADQIYNLQSNNFTCTGFAFHPRLVQSLRKAKDSQNRYLWEPGVPSMNVPASIEGVPYATTTQLSIALTQGSATTATTIVAGQWDQAVIFERGGRTAGQRECVAVDGVRRDVHQVREVAPLDGGRARLAGPLRRRDVRADGQVRPAGDERCGVGVAAGAARDGQRLAVEHRGD